MAKDKKPCPFEVVDIISKGYEGWVNFVHVETRYCLTMVRPEFANDLKELVGSWDKQKNESKKT